MKDQITRLRQAIDMQHFRCEEMTRRVTERRQDHTKTRTLEHNFPCSPLSRPSQRSRIHKAVCRRIWAEARTPRSERTIACRENNTPQTQTPSFKKITPNSWNNKPAHLCLPLAGMAVIGHTNADSPASSLHFSLHTVTSCKHESIS